MEKHSTTRRGFLRTLILGGAGLFGLWRFLTPRRTVGPDEIVVPVDEVPAGGALALPTAGLAITRSKTDLFRALDLTCTHLGCQVRATEKGFTCPCHGSRFDEQGRVLVGPATRSLHVLAIRKEDGALHVSPEARS